MSITDKFNASAEKYINKYGKTVVFHSLASASYDVANSVAAVTTTSQTLKAIVEMPTVTRVARGDSSKEGVADFNRKLTIAAISCNIAPKAGDTFTFDGNTYKVADRPDSVEIVYSGDDAVIYQITCSKT